MAVVVTLLVMTAVRWWSHRGPRAAQPVTGPLAAAGLLLVPLTAGHSPADAGLAVPGRTAVAYALTSVAVVAAGYALALAVPLTRRLLGAAAGAGERSALRTAFVAVPLSTVVFEEVAFRGVLWGLLAHAYGPHPATAVTAALFGLWHVPPHRARIVAVAGTVLFTAAAGVLFGELRHTTGGVLAPAALHWATNGLGVLAGALAARGRH